MRRPNYGNRSLLSERSAERSGATQKSGGAERSGERALQKNDGAERSGAGGRGAGTERGAEVTGLGWSVERFFLPAPLRSHALLGVTLSSRRSVADHVQNVSS